MKKNHKKSQIFSGIALGVFGLALVMVIFGFASTIGEVSENMIAETPTAILARTEVGDGVNVSVPVMYYDQRADECVNIYDIGNLSVSGQFGWNNCGLHEKRLEQGLIEYKLGQGMLPVVAMNNGFGGSSIDMKRWFTTIDGVSQGYNDTIKFYYNQKDKIYSFDDGDFYPLDGVEFSAQDKVNGDGHNHLFTMNFALPFVVLTSGEEAFEISADDDTFVFVGDRLAIDMGGIHEPIKGRFVINKNGEVYAAVGEEDLGFTGVKLKEGDDSIVRIYHADRDSTDSSMNIKVSKMSLGIMNTTMAKNGESGMQIAYDPSDPSFVAPLGESIETRPSNYKGMMIVATVESVVIVTLAILMMIVTRFMVKVNR